MWTVGDMEIKGNYWGGGRGTGERYNRRDGYGQSTYAGTEISQENTLVCTS